MIGSRPAPALRPMSGAHQLVASEILTATIDVTSHLTAIIASRFVAHAGTALHIKDLLLKNLSTIHRLTLIQNDHLLLLVIHHRLVSVHRLTYSHLCIILLLTHWLLSAVLNGLLHTLILF